MSEQSPPRHPPTPELEEAGVSALSEEEPDRTASEDAAGEADPFDDLWDPDMDTRPERIRKTKVRSRVDSRTRGRSSPRVKKREET